MKKLLKITLTLFFITIIVLGFAVPLNMAGNWYQQFFPNLNGTTISDITFTDSLTGFAVTQSASVTDTGYILKTTNGGDLWVIKHRFIDDYTKVMFVNSITGYISDGDLLKTTNGGENWSGINRPNITKIEDMFVLSHDTIWLVDDNSIAGGVYRTTNGGVNWSQQFSQSGNNPAHIYMYNARIGFIDGGVGLRKTTDSGLSWTPISGAGNFLDMYFTDSLTGWKSNLDMKKTTNGGLNWITQILPSGGMIITSMVNKFYNINSDTIWAAGGWAQFPNFQSRGIIYRTTNGGDNWKFQIPDTSINIFQYFHVEFANKRNGWIYGGLSGIHTTNGGDTTFYLGMQQISSEIPKEYLLYQNYPNPFNPATNIKYQISNHSEVKLTVFDVQGKEVTTLVNSQQSVGIYLVDWNAFSYSSGVYFYKLTVIGGKEIFSQTKKMILIK